jgi:hypothetical protein
VFLIRSSKVCSEDADLGNLAERLVGLSVHALLIKYGKITVRYFEHREAEHTSDAKITCELSSILLKRPKELVSTYKENNSASVAPVQTTKYSTFESILFKSQLFSFYTCKYSV